MMHASEAEDLSFSDKRYGRLIRLAIDLVKYAFASVAALALDYGLLMLLYRALGINYLIAAAIGFSAGLGFVYLLSVCYVFSDCRRFRPGPELLGFLATGLIGLLINEALMRFFVETLCLSVALAKMPSAGLVFTFNFMTRRALLFSPVAAISKDDRAS